MASARQIAEPGAASQTQAVEQYNNSRRNRYGQGGLIRERFRDPDFGGLCAKPPDGGGPTTSIRTGSAAMMRNEKPGGHGERSVAVETLRHARRTRRRRSSASAVPDVGAERRRGEPALLVTRAVATIPEGRIPPRAEARLPRTRYNVVKMNIGGAPIDEDRRRIEAVPPRSRTGPLGGGCRITVHLRRHRVCPDAPELSAFWYEEAGDPRLRAPGGAPALLSGSMATGEYLFSHQDARNLLLHGTCAPSDWLQFDCALLGTGCGATRHPRRAGRVAGHGPAAPHGRSMSLDIAAGLGLGGNEDLSGPVPAYGGFPDGSVEDARRHAGTAGHRIRGQGGPDRGETRFG